jgi:hypothetical protein
MPAQTAKTFDYQLKITLVGIHPPIWRRILVPSTMRLCCLHDAIQAVFGWTDTHLLPIPVKRIAFPLRCE